MSISTRTPPPSTSRWVEAQAIKDREQQRNRRRAFYCVASIVAAALLGVAVWELIDVYKAHKHQQFINSIKDDPQKIRAAGEAGQLTDAERMSMFRDLGEERQDKQYDEYFAMTPAARAAWMLQYVKDEIEHQKERDARRASGQGPTTRRWGGGNNSNSAQNQANWAAQNVARHENRNPTRTAQMQQFMADRAAAYKQLGQQPPQGRGGGGGFGGGGRGR